MGIPTEQVGNRDSDQDIDNGDNGPRSPWDVKQDRYMPACDLGVHRVLFGCLTGRKTIPVQCPSPIRLVKKFLDENQLSSVDACQLYVDHHSMLHATQRFRSHPHERGDHILRHTRYDVRAGFKKIPVALIEAHTETSGYPVLKANKVTGDHMHHETQVFWV